MKIQLFFYLIFFFSLSFNINATASANVNASASTNVSTIELFKKNCASCHGDDRLGLIGPPLMWLYLTGHTT